MRVGNELVSPQDEPMKIVFRANDSISFHTLQYFAANFVEYWKQLKQIGTL